MNLSEIVRVIRRRWYVTVPAVVLAIAMTTVTYLLVPVKYQSESSVALLNTPLPTEKSPAPGNPFLNFDASLVATADFLARSLVSDEAAKELKSMGVTETYTAKLADNAMGPFITLTVTGTDSNDVMASTEKLTGYAEQKLQQIQKDNGVPASVMIHSARIIPPQKPAPQTKSQVQAVAGVAGVGLTMAFLAAFLTDGLARARQRKRSSKNAEPARETAAERTAEIRLPVRTIDRNLSTDQTVVITSTPGPWHPAEKDRPGIASNYRPHVAPAQRREADPFVGG